MRDSGSERPDGSEHPAAAEKRLVNHSASLVRGLSNTGVSVLYCDEDLRCIWAVNVPPAWSRDQVANRRFHEFLPPEPAEQLTRVLQAAVASAKPQMLEVSLPYNHETRWFSVWIDLEASKHDEPAGVIVTVVDITEQKWREQTLRALLREVAHRSKNLLAIIQSIATQTGRHSDTIDGFMSRFRGRLQSLASTQDLVTSSNWRGADLYELVLGQVGRYTADPSRSILFEGQRPYLNPNAALHIGLALHELAVNSVSYGALARPDGTVSIRAQLNGIGPRRGLSLTWSEIISIGDQAVGRKRFGSVALERVVPASLDGTAQLSISSERLDYRLTVPAGNFESE